LAAGVERCSEVEGRGSVCGGRLGVFDRACAEAEVTRRLSESEVSEDIACRLETADESFEGGTEPVAQLHEPASFCGVGEDCFELGDFCEPLDGGQQEVDL